MSLYRKYRPQTFTDVVGQDHVKTVLMQAVKMNKVAHAYLFCGPRGTGKTSSARILAKCLNCTDIQESGEPCQKCENCQEITSGSFPDLIEIDAASNRGIDEIRMLKEKMNFLPSKGTKKVYIIDEVHMLTKEAFNALLKTLEEPPEHVSFILATTEAHKIPDTVISRCQNFQFKPITQPQLEKHLQHIAQSENLTLEESIFRIIARKARGGLRDAISLLDQLRSADSITAESLREEFGIVDESQFETLWEALKNCQTHEALQVIDWLADNGYQLDQVCVNFLYYIREQLRSAAKNSTNETAFIIYCLDAFEAAREKLKTTAIMQLPLEIAIIKICERNSGNTEYGTRNAERGMKNEENKDRITTHDALPVTNNKEMGNTEQGIRNTKNKDGMTHDALPVTNNKEMGNTEQGIRNTENKDGMTHDSLPITPPQETPNNIEPKNENESPDILSVKEKWPNIIKHIQTAFLRVSLKNASILNVNSNTLTLGISNQFEVDKVNGAESQKELTSTIKSLTGWDMQIQCQLTSSTHTPVVKAAELASSQEPVVTGHQSLDNGKAPVSDKQAQSDTINSQQSLNNSNSPVSGEELPMAKPEGTQNTDNQQNITPQPQKDSDISDLKKDVASIFQ